MSAPTTLPPPREHRFTVEEYHRMGQAGIFHEDDHVELLAGKIYVTSPIGSPHAACVRRLNRLFVRAVDPHALVSVQNPIRINRHSEPEPDVALLEPRNDDYAARHPHPDEVMLVVEVADTSLAFDRDTKLPLYARAEIPEVWLVALDEGRVHVYRRPEGDVYADHATHEAEDAIAVQLLPDAGSFPLRDVLGD